MGSATLTFKQQLQFGQTGESMIARWLRSRGNAVMPVYEKLIESGKGPQLFLPEGSLIAPDMFVYKGGKAMWVEAKHKTAFSYHRKTDKWVTGIDLRHYEDYCKVADSSPWPVWLLFIQKGGQAKDSPPNSPAGLYGNTLAYLRNHENHRWSDVGMVYWDIKDLRHLAALEELERL